jgi:hypothetical protein
VTLFDLSWILANPASLLGLALFLAVAALVSR